MSAAAAVAASRAVSITYVPADCGSIIPGKSKAPKAFQDVGIVERLQDAGIPSVSEHQALDSPATYSVAPLSQNGVRNEDLNISVCQQVQRTITQNLSSTNNNPELTASGPPPFQLILGGECGMLPGILTSFWQHYTPSQPSSLTPTKRIGLLYIDADTDLSTPNSPTHTGTFASMNMTHLTQSPGSLPTMSRFTQTSGNPLCDATNTVFFGLNISLSSNTRPHLATLFDNNYKVITSTAVAQDPEQSAKRALAYLHEQNVDVIVVHLDVDAIDASLFPLANVPNFTGIRFEEMIRALEVVLRDESIAALVVAEVNPDHDPGLRMVGRLTEGLVRMLAAR